MSDPTDFNELLIQVDPAVDRTSESETGVRRALLACGSVW